MRTQDGQTNLEVTTHLILLSDLLQYSMDMSWCKRHLLDSLVAIISCLSPVVATLPFIQSSLKKETGGCDSKKYQKYSF